MTIYDLISQNTRKTYFLISLFLIVIIGLGWLFATVTKEPLILIIAVIFSVTISILSYWRSDKIILSIYKAKEITRESNPEIYKIVENLAITAGLPTPKIYLIEDPSPNAFATGRDPKHAAIALTSGLINLLDKQELEGVIGHELTHIKNRDTLLATVVVILVGIVALASEFFLRTSFWFERDDNDSSSTLLFIGAIIAALLAPFVATIIQLAISRKREFLADAGSVMLTRYPEGLIRALIKISRSPIPLKRASTATAHLFIVNPLKKNKNKRGISWFKKLFMTHPPVEERIKALETMI